MSLRVAVEHIDPDKPIHAATAAVSGTFERLAPARGVLLALAGWGDGPAVAVAPWVLAGIQTAATQHGLGLEAVDLGPVDAHAGQRRRLTAAGIPLAQVEGRPLLLELAGSRRPRRIPQPWFGQHLCLAVPCAHTRKSRVNGGAWMGPVEAAFAALDRACRPAGLSADSPIVGARLAAAVFASTTIVLDGTWWAPLSSGDTSAPNIIRLDRCFASSSGTPSEDWNQRILGELDGWLAARLRMGSAFRGRSPEIDPRGSAAHAPWPRAPKLNGSPGRGLAGQALEALWSRRPRRPAGRPALPATVPGPMARHWHDDSGSGSR